MAIAPAILLRGIGLAIASPAGAAGCRAVLLLWGGRLPLPGGELSAWAVEHQARTWPTHFLRKLAKTWAYFETHVGPDDYWLPPDNLQGIRRSESRIDCRPIGIVTARHLTAHDFGYPTGQLIERTTNALTRWRCWRDIGPFLQLVRHADAIASGASVRVTVIAQSRGHLLTLRPGLAALPDAAILNRRWVEGVSDTYAVLVMPWERMRGQRLRNSRNLNPRSHRRRRLAPHRLPPRVHKPAGCMRRRLRWSRRQRCGFATEAQFWADALARHCADLRDDLMFLAPWLAATGTRNAPARDAGDGSPRFVNLRRLVRSPPCTGAARAAERIAAIEQLALRATEFATIDYDFLFDKVRRQLVIGYNVADRRSDNSYYDLLASEARLCNFVAIAQGALPQESWFALGRLLTAGGREPVLLSWSGSMFEYLMPLLVMPTFENTLLDQTYRASVERQIEYGRQRGVPWGMSESGYNTVDVHQNYQYRAFGVPGWA
jgi:hypothetical protein